MKFNTIWYEGVRNLLWRHAEFSVENAGLHEVIYDFYKDAGFYMKKMQFRLKNVRVIW
jgi:hypothetical protein